ncbi:MAG: dihydroneopterin aldolase [Candidatus Kapaibacterium sp.]
MFIRLNGIKIFARHGVYDEEIKGGNHFEIDLEVKMSDMPGKSKDMLADTLDYTELYKSVIAVSQNKRYNLLETFASDICTTILETFAETENVRVKVRKMHPPVGGEVMSVEVDLGKRRSNA